MGASLGGRIVTQTRLFPERTSSASGHNSDTSNTQPTIVPLSCVDATVARFSPASAVWFFDKPPQCKDGAAPLSPDHLTLSLQKTLNAYPQWAGQLRWAPYVPRGDHTQRYGRLNLVYGSKEDPGVELVVMHVPRTLNSMVPDAAERAAGNGSWNAGQTSWDELLPSTSMAPSEESATDGSGRLPCMLVQITTFDCGGVAIGLKFPHPLADAQTLVRFVHDWASVNRALTGQQPLPVLNPVFNPMMLDLSAAGDINAAEPNADLLGVAGELPLHRYDWWASAQGCPQFMLQATRIPSYLDPAVVGPLGQPMPWQEWDPLADVDHYDIHFSNEEIEKAWEEASLDASSVRVSRLDALLAHLWSLIIRARCLGRDEEVFLDVTLGLRTRLDPRFRRLSSVRRSRWQELLLRQALDLITLSDPWLYPFVPRLCSSTRPQWGQCCTTWPIQSVRKGYGTASSVVAIRS